MVWYQNFMKFQQNPHERWADLDLGDGHKVYSFRQVDMWRRLGSNAGTLFRKVREGPSLEGQGVSGGSNSADDLTRGVLDPIGDRITLDEDLYSHDPIE